MTIKREIDPSMNEYDQAYQVPDGTDLHAIKASLEALGAVREDESHHLLRRFYDTFDWSLYNAGSVLEERLEGHRRLFIWRDMHGKTTPVLWEMDRDLGFAADLPAGADLAPLTALLGIRRLLPLLDVHSQLQTWRLLNGDEKTVVRIELEQNRFEDKGRGRQGQGETVLSLTNPVAEGLTLDPGQTRSAALHCPPSWRGETGIELARHHPATGRGRRGTALQSAA